MVGVGWRGGSGWDSDNAATHRELRRELREGGGGVAHPRRPSRPKAHLDCARFQVRRGRRGRPWEGLPFAPSIWPIVDVVG